MIHSLKHLSKRLKKKKHLKKKPKIAIKHAGLPSHPTGTSSGSLRPGILPPGSTVKPSTIPIPSTSGGGGSGSGSGGGGSGNKDGSKDTQNTTGSSQNKWVEAAEMAAIGGGTMALAGKVIEKGPTGLVKGIGNRIRDNPLTRQARRYWNRTESNPMNATQRRLNINKTMNTSPKGTNYRTIKTPEGKSINIKNYNKYSNTVKTNSGNTRQLHEANDGTRLVKEEYKYNPENESFTHNESGDTFRYNEPANEYQRVDESNNFVSEENPNVFSENSKSLDEFTEPIENAASETSVEVPDIPSDFNPAIAEDAPLLGEEAGIGLESLEFLSFL